jgi:release factor glutamine methyltransferase
VRSRTTKSAEGSKSRRLREATVARTVRDATERLAAAGCETPRLDAELLVAEALGVRREDLLLDRDRGIDPKAVEELLARRLAREPVAYILGRKDFRHLTLAVDRRVLIPRPETEVLVEVGLTLRSGARVVDVGTGSGALALALKDERPDLDVWATDASADALALARENAAALGLEVQFVHGDLLDGAPANPDAVLANLPYVPADFELAPEITDYEPHGAVFAGRDGLELMRRLAGQAAGVPLIALEVGFDQAAAVTELLSAAGFRSIERLKDLAGHERVVIGRTA